MLVYNYIAKKKQNLGELSIPGKIRAQSTIVYNK